MSELLLLPTLDRLEPYDEPTATGKKLAFGLTLQVALADNDLFDANEHGKFLRPWTWKVPRTVRLFGVDEDGWHLPGFEFDLELLGPEAARSKVELGPHSRWIEGLNTYFERLAEAGTNPHEEAIWAWSTGAGSQAEITDRRDREKVKRYWPAYLGQLSLEPWPLAQSLQLSYFFRTKAMAMPPHGFVAAPILPAGCFVDDWPELRPAPCGPDNAFRHNATDLFRMEYVEKAPPPPITASISSATPETDDPTGSKGEAENGGTPVAVPGTEAEAGASSAAEASGTNGPATNEPATELGEAATTASSPYNFRVLTRSVETKERTRDVAYFDMSSLWVKDPNHSGTSTGGSTWRGDWRSQLEDRLAEGLRLGPMLVEGIEHLLEQENNEDELKALYAVLPTLARTGVALIADAYGPGSRTATPGGSLATRVEPDADVARTLEENLSKEIYGVGRNSFTSHALGRPAPGRSWTDTRLGKWAEKVEEVSGNGSALLVLEQAEGLELEAILGHLRSLEATLAREEVTEKLVRELWKRASVDLPVRDKLPFSNVRRQLGRDQLGLVWPDIQTALGAAEHRTQGQLRQEILEALLKHAKGTHRLGSLPILVTFARDRLTAVLRRAIPDIPLEDGNTSSDPTTGGMRHSRGLTFQVDTLGRDPAEVPGAAQDLLERIQGVGVMMRRSPQGPRETPWMALNIGKAVLVDADGVVHEDQVIADKVLLPSRLAYREGLREVSITYDNAPIGPQSELTRAYPEGLSGKGENDASPRAPVDIRYLASDVCAVPSLAYGAIYEISPFLVTTNGAAPKAVVEDGSLPWGPVCSTGSLDSNATIRWLSYRRQQKVGALRPISSTDGTNVRQRRKFDLPAVPEGVELRVRELSGRHGLPDAGRRTEGAGLPIEVPVEGKKAIVGEGRDAKYVLTDDVPCLFLMAESHRRQGVKVPSSFAFGLRSPAVDLETWDRYRALDFDPADPDQYHWRRERVWESVYLGAAENRAKENDPIFFPHDLLLDDPAVIGIEATLWHIEDDGTVRSVGQAVEVDWPAWTGPPEEENRPARVSLAREQRSAVGVSVEVGVSASLEPVPTPDPGKPGGVLARVEEGGTYRLTLRARLHANAAERIAPEVEPEPQTSPWHLAIEVAEPFVLEASRDRLRRRLWENLLPEASSAPLGRLHLRFAGLEAFDGEEAVDAELRQRVARHVVGARLRHQSWGWRGRPPIRRPNARAHPDIGDPYTSTGSNNAQRALGEQSHYLEWELAHLGDRNDFEARHVEMRRSFDPRKPAAGSSFVLDEALEAGGDADFRANHHRFGLEVRSRYAPVLDRDSGHIAARDVPLPEDPSDLRSHWPWRSLFVPCRFPVPRPKNAAEAAEPIELAAVPVPKVRAILPLTDRREITTPDPDRQAGGWLVVLDEVWYEVGGLAEELHVEVMQVISPNQEWPAGGPADPGTCGENEADCAYLQMGPDPIVTDDDIIDAIGGQAPDFRALDQSRYEVVFDTIFGPAGHHRDFSERSPRMLASSFVVRPPRIDGPKTRPDDQVDPSFWMFQVRLRRQLHVEGRSAPVWSEPTAPYWVQLLPPVARLDEHWLGERFEKDGRVRLEGHQVVLELPDGGRVRPHETFELYAVFTREVVDVTGNRDQEVYVGVSGPIEGDRFLAPERVIDTETARLQLVADNGSSPAPSPAEGRLWMRLMEVQRPEGARNPRSEENLWRLLFDPSIEKDRDRGRIIRISSALEVETPQLAGARR